MHVKLKLLLFFFIPLQYGPLLVPDEERGEISHDWATEKISGCSKRVSQNERSERDHCVMSSCWQYGFFYGCKLRFEPERDPILSLAGALSGVLFSLASARKWRTAPRPRKIPAAPSESRCLMVSSPSLSFPPHHAAMNWRWSPR